MFSPLETTMELLPLCLCVLAWAAGTAADGSGPEKLIVKEDSDVILPCSRSTKENLESEVFDWIRDGPQREVFKYTKGTHYNNGRSGQSEQFKGRVFHFQDELKHGNASIMIRKTKVKDSGRYTCKFPKLQPPNEFPVELVVGACPVPAVEILDPTEDGVLLQCKIQGAFPAPHVQWQDSAGNKFPAAEPEVTENGGKYDIILKTTVTRSDRYTCVSTQEEICHSISAGTYVPFNDPRSDEKPKESFNGWIVGVTVAVAVALIFGFAAGGVSVYMCYIKQQRKNDEAQDGLSSGAAERLNPEKQQSGSVL